MNSSIANTKPDGSPKRTITASAEEIEANHLAARQDAKEIVEGLRRFAQQKAALKVPNQAA